jgi:hypothetical protein
MSAHIQDYKLASSIQYAFSQDSEQMLKNMKDEYNGMPVDIILHEATTILQAARQHALELSEVGLTDNELNRMRFLITHVAAHTYTSLWNNINITAEVHELRIVKDVIFRAAEMRFGSTNSILNEFKYDAKDHSII